MNRTSDRNIRYDVTKPVEVHTNQQSGSALVQCSEQAENHFSHTFCGYDQSLPKTFTSTSAPLTAPRVKFDENVYYNILTSIRPTPLCDVNNILLSSTYDLSSVINNAALSQSGYRSPSSLQPHGMPGDYYSTSLPESFIPISNSQVCASHPHLTSCVFHKDDLFLPRPEFVKFNGNLLNFTTFKLTLKNTSNLK